VGYYSTLTDQKYFLTKIFPYTSFYEGQYGKRQYILGMKKLYCGRQYPFKINSDNSTIKGENFMKIG
jgi:hypothetical protein